MKNILISAIALITFGMAATEADAQFYVVKDGKVVYDLSDLPDSVTFEKPSFTVTFDSGEDATPVEKQDVKYNATATKPDDPVRTGYEFKGWYVGANTLFKFSEPINGDITLTARWKEETAGGTYTVATPDAVDLGLSVKWANFNIGATKPEEYGDYFAWGELEPHYADGSWLDGYDGYNWANYKWVEAGGSSWTDINKYTAPDNQKDGIWYNGDEFIGDNKTELEDADDVAVQRLGNDWQMPTYKQQEELIKNCYWVWTNNYNGVKGYIVYKVKDDADKGLRVYDGETDTKNYDVDNDVHIFLPAAGYRSGAGLGYAGSRGDYWSRSLYTYDSDFARSLYFNSGFVYTDDILRGFGQSVRAVQRK